MSEDKITRQLQLEAESVSLGVQRYRKAIQESNLSDTPPGLSLMRKCIEPLVEKIKEFNGNGYNGHVKKFLDLFDPYEVAWLTAKRCINCILKNEEVIQGVALDIADSLLDHLEYTKFRQKHPGFLARVESNLHTSHKRHRRAVIMRAKRLLGVEDTKITDKARVGLKLIYMFIEATHWLEIDHNWKNLVVLRPNPEIKKKIEEVNRTLEVLDPIYMPMIIRPWPWLSVIGGGYLSSNTGIAQKLVRTRDLMFLQELADHPMPEVYEAINHLQGVPFRINRRIFETMREVWEAGGVLGGLPPRDEEPLPVKEWDEENEKPTEEQLKEYKRRARDIYIRRAEVVGQRVELFHKLRIAEKFLEEPELYFCWNLDFRGRLYPIQNFLHPQGCDTSRALLEFSEGKPLGKRGAFWLKVHLANCYGIKGSFEDRVSWVETNEALILNSASNPINGQRFWTEADDPWQFLAACFEYQGYKKQGEFYISHLPVSVDATASGLQHLSALLLDEVGGQAVNLTPGFKPSDIYQRVATELLKIIEREAKEGNTLAQVWLEYGIDRDLTKRGVMTTPYGVTRYGVTDQLLDKVSGKIPANQVLEACQYLAPKLIEATHKVVIAADKVMGWLQEVATVFNKAGLPIQWQTPTGFIVKQNYRSQPNKTVMTYFGKQRIRLGFKTLSDKLYRRGQVNGISPNFIHSLDSSHLMKTINQCFKEGMTSFTCIHDSFGTHACDIDKLNRILREEFVTMYSRDLLADLRDQILNQLPEEYHREIPPLPQRGTLDITQVKDSLFFFS